MFLIFVIVVGCYFFWSDYIEIDNVVLPGAQDSELPNDLNIIRSYSSIGANPKGVEITFKNGKTWDLRTVHIAGTGSMKPTYSRDMVVIELIPKNESDIQVGDIISFNVSDSPIIHRVIEIGEDDFGWYCLTKGDNNKVPDNVTLRFEDVHGIAWIDIR